MENKKTSILFIIFCAIIGNWIGYLIFFLIPFLNGLLGSFGTGLYLVIMATVGGYLGSLKKFELTQIVTTNTQKIKKILKLILLIILATATILFDFLITSFYIEKFIKY